MCGLVGIFSNHGDLACLERAAGTLRHRGPDDQASWVSPLGRGMLAHTRLRVIDLSEAGSQPMHDATGRYTLAFNGEIYNYRELRSELAGSYPFTSATDSEVLLAAYARWGRACLDHLLGMFAFVIWDEHEQSVFAARDRFGVKPLYYAHSDGALMVASEIKALHALGVPAEPDEAVWATYLTTGRSDGGRRTFWQSINALPGGHCLTWTPESLRVERWYDIAERIGTAYDERDESVVIEEYLALMLDSVQLRFRADVPVGINLSGGLDSSTLLAAVHGAQGSDSEVTAFTFVTGDPNYDELPWVHEMLDATQHPLVVCRLDAADVPDLAADVQEFEDEPFGGVPTLAYARLFEHARERGIVALLDGQGMDEQWAGYDYYRSNADAPASVVQGTTSSPVRPECLEPDFAAAALDEEIVDPFGDRLRNLQYRDLTRTKIPRALRYNDRVSMRASRELREPFLDHRLVELALRQPAHRKLNAQESKVLLRKMVGEQLPAKVVNAPKRPVQTPQREWLRGPLRPWVTDLVDVAKACRGGAWLRGDAVDAALSGFFRGESDNSFFVWQWLSIALLSRHPSSVA